MSAAGGLITVVDGIAFGLLLFTVAAGLSLSFGAAGVLNLAHGATWLAGAYIGWSFIAASWTGLTIAIAVAAVAGAIGGLAIALLLRHVAGHLMQALATIGVAILISLALTKTFGPQPLAVTPPALVDRSINLFGRPYPLYRLLFIGIGVAAALLMWWLLHRTRAGLLIRAAAQDPRTLETLGVDPRQVSIAVVMAAAVSAAVAGVLGSPLLGPAPGVDHTVMVLSLVIVVVGGLQSIGGTMIAALAVGQIQTTLAVTWSSAAPYLPYVILIAAVAARATLSRYRIRSA